MELGESLWIGRRCLAVVTLLCGSDVALVVWKIFLATEFGRECAAGRLVELTARFGVRLRKIEANWLEVLKRHEQLGL